MEQNTNERQTAIVWLGRTHTARLARGAARLAADLDVPVLEAAEVLGVVVEGEREMVERLLREGRY